MENLIYLLPIFGILGLIYMAYLYSWVSKQDGGTSKMKEISDSIAEGAMSFLKAEYRVLSIFVFIAGAALGFLSTQVATTHWFIVFAFVLGAVFSVLAGYIGMKIATKANVRTTHAARTSLSAALQVAFRGGTVMGLGVAGLAVLGLSALFALFFNYYMDGSWAISTIKGVQRSPTEAMSVILEVLAGFSLGAESIALFARVGGGIYTKAADVGADLVGKVEAGIPEDDPRNPATIADNVGDNVGDVAGMGADLFGSYVATVLAAMVLGNYVIKDMGGSVNDQFGGLGPILLPVLLAGLGIIFSILGTFFVRVSNENAKEAQVQSALNMGNWSSIIMTAIASFFCIQWMLPEVMKMNFFGQGLVNVTSMQVFYAVLIGLGVGGAISYLTEYYTGLGKGPVNDIVQKSGTGAATNIIGGLSNGMLSTAMPVLLFAAAIWGAYSLAGFYGVAIAASAMMATTAMQLAIDAFGPIADNAGGIAEMSELPKEVRVKTDILDSVGNTTAAIGKGFAIASAALTALGLFAAYVTFTGINGINIFKADVLAALFVATSALVFTGCNDDEDEMDMAKVLVVHASPDAPGVDILVDDTKVKTAALTFPNNTAYLDVEAGQRNIKVNVSGANPAVTAINTNVTFVKDKNYSVFAGNAVANIEPLLFEDDLATPATGKAHVRFIHLSPDAPAVDVALTGGAAVFPNISFKNGTSFTPLDAGTYNLEVRVAGTQTVALPLPGVVLEAGKIYTVFAKGFLAGTGAQALGAQIIVNN